MINTDLCPAVESLLVSQERYQCMQDAAYRHWGRDLCDLGYANFHGGPSSAILQALVDCLQDLRPFDLQYTPYGGATITRRLIAQNLTRSHALPFAWRNVIMTPGAMAALNILFRALRTEDSSAEVIVVVPCWLDYPLYLTNFGFRPVLVPVTPRTLRLDVDRIADAVSTATCAIVLSQPANPTGKVYSPQELSDLAEVLRARSDNHILLISDECHRETVFPGSRFVSPAEFYDTTCIVYSFGKAFHIQGQRIGYIAVSPKMQDPGAVSRLLERLCRVTGFCTPTSLMQLAVRRLLSIKLDIAPITSQRKFVVETLREAGYAIEPSEGTYFLYPESPMRDDLKFVELLAQNGVLTLPASIFHHRGHFRVSLTAPESQIEKALQVIVAVRERSRTYQDCASA